LVVPFDPANVTALASFRAKYSVPPAVAVYGPYSGKLDNAGESIALSRPDTPQPAGAPDAGFVSYILVDKVDYRDATPWPAGAVDGGGLSLQRKGNSLYGNEPLNWVASTPTPGAINGAGIVPPPTITSSPSSQMAFAGDPITLGVAATGADPLSYQWRFNGTPLPNATNAALSLSYAVLEDDGDYDCLVSNAGGAALTTMARLVVMARPMVLLPPSSVMIRQGSNAVFAVFATGSEPLRYQWRFNGVPLPGETNATLTRTNVQLADDGDYDVLVSNPLATALASAHLTVLINTAIVLPPTSLSVVTGAAFTVSVVASGNPLPFGYEWRRISTVVASNTVYSTVHFATFIAPTNLVTNQTWRVVVRNVANSGISAVASFAVSTLVDSDLDGIPDVADANPLDATDAGLDSDGDGMSNRSEYIAGTNPTDPLSYLKLEQDVTTGSVLLRFGAISNRTYSIQYTDTLGIGPWLTLTSFPARSTNRV